MNIEQCPSYEGCEAPLCPLDEGLEDAVWYPDEDICGSRKHFRIHWIRIQKRIKKLNIGYDVGYFTVERLNKIHLVKNGIKGINPDSRAALQNSN